MTKIRDTARGLVVRGEDILLMERRRNGQHYYSIPGGKIEEGESEEETVQREIMEETGVSVKTDKLVAELRVADSSHYIFLCDYVSGEPSLQQDSEEATTNSHENSFNPNWQPVSEIDKLYLRYWEPLKPLLLEGLSNGFPDKPQIIIVR